MIKKSRMICLICGFCVTLSVTACVLVTGNGDRREIPQQAPVTLPDNVPAGSTLVSSTTRIENGQTINHFVFRAPHQIVFNAPICSKGDPQYPACLRTPALMKHKHR